MTGLTAVVPCFNEGEQVAAAHRAIVSALGAIPELEIIFIDDGSSDDTLEHMRAIAARDGRVRYISFSRNFGLSAAISAGFRYASHPWIVQLDADLQVPPDQTWVLLAEAAKGYDVVFGTRRVRHDPLLRRLGAAGHQWAARRLLGVEVPMGASSFRVLRAPVARTLAELRMNNAYFAAKAPLVTSRYTTVQTTHRARESGRSRFRPLRLGGHAFELFFGFSWRPLNAAYLIAAVAAAVAAALTVGWLLGLVAPAAVAVAALDSSALTAVVCALSARYLHRLMLDATPLRAFYIAESNLDVRPEDTLDGGVPAVPPPALPPEKGHDHGR
ncbi:glycosyl transferase [Acrocarpospora pleiomorpha]|uniref:Glycosyl transferase n=1 Tax=Acrocarpospora pleiomorpha TaxID=90975 RepID=A0A5M3XI99_9ACTN|nr:glycosyltransferase family 2 protein [Acrocarpospora pleiomorpha]GES20492.1 glycosyl transferase [Acrocarpospora pleiomorpha]